MTFIWKNTNTGYLFITLTQLLLCMPAPSSVFTFLFVFNSWACTVTVLSETNQGVYSPLVKPKKWVLAQGTQHAQYQPLSGALTQNEEHKQIRFHHQFSQGVLILWFICVHYF